MLWHRVAGICLALLSLTSCRPDELELAYRFPETATLRYRLTAAADAAWRINGLGDGSYTAVFDVTERIVEETAGRALVTVVMDPVRIDERGLPSPGEGRRSFTLRLGRKGEVLEVVSVGDIAARDLAPDQLALIGTYRPPLPLEAVGIGDRWRSSQRLDVGPSSQQAATIGRLRGFGYEDGPVAELDYRGEGPSIWTIGVPQGDARLEGATATRTDAVIDIRRGLLRKATSTTTGRFDVSVATGSDGLPVTGDLTLRLHMRLRLLKATGA